MERLDLKVSGMHCDNCENAIQRAVGELPGVKSVKADHASGAVTVDADQLDRAAIEAAIAEAGFEVVPA